MRALLWGLSCLRSFCVCLLQCFLLTLHQSLLEGLELHPSPYIIYYILHNQMADQKEIVGWGWCLPTSPINNKMPVSWQNRRLNFTIRTENWVYMALATSVHSKSVFSSLTPTVYFEILFLWNPHIGSDTRWLQEVVFHVVPEGQSGLLFEPVTSGHPRGHFPGKGKPE